MRLSRLSLASLATGAVTAATPLLAPLPTACGQSTPSAASAPADSLTLDSALARANAPGLGESERARRYVVTIRAFLKAGQTGVGTAEQMAARLDSLHPSDTVAWLQLLGHKTLLGYYRGVDNDAGIVAHATRVFALAPSVPAVSREKARGALVLAYTAMAEVYGDRAQADSAVALLTRGVAALGDVAEMKEALESTRARYAMVGTRGAPIETQHWFNAPAGTTRLTPTGAVTLLEFSAHWCGPCRKSYPAITRLQQTYGSRGLRTVLVTMTYGFFQGQQNLTPAQELSADSTYYLKEHALPAEVAVYERPANSTVMPNEASYHVSGIPQIVVLDREGVVRMVVVGWDPASEQSIARTIESLLAAPAPRKTAAR